MEEAVKLASQIGLTEEAFHEKGGGLLFWAAIVFVGVFILTYAAVTKPKK